MKKILWGAMVAILGIPVCASAQLREVEPFEFRPATEFEPFAFRPATESGHSISIELLGLTYTYEHAIGRTGTIIGRANVNFGGAWDSWRTGTSVSYADVDHFYWMLVPSIEVEPRWYYGLDRRASMGRSTARNSGSFLSLRVLNTFPGYISDDDYMIVGSTTFSPAWGLRRVWGMDDRWMFEFSVGPVVGFVHRDRWWGDDRIIGSMEVNIRFGVAF